MNWRRWTEAADAPHGKLFYGFIVLFGAVGVVFFLDVALDNPTESSLVWRVAYAARAPLYLLGMLQGLERLMLPERALVRASELSEGERLSILVGRWVTIGVSLGGFAVVCLVGLFAESATQQVCDDLRILFLSMLFLCFCLADLAGETTFPQSMWTTAWRPDSKDGNGGLAKRRKSFY